MIHPDTELRFVSKEVGYGVFATNLLPKGTILFARDKLDLVLTPKQYKALDSSFFHRADERSNNWGRPWKTIDTKPPSNVVVFLC